MQQGRFTEDQIIGVLREHEAGVKTAEPCRKHGVSDATFYNWKTKYGGMTVGGGAVADAGVRESTAEEAFGGVDARRLVRRRPVPAVPDFAMLAGYRQFVHRHIGNGTRKRRDPMTNVVTSQYVAAWSASPFANVDLPPWIAVENVDFLVREALKKLGDEYIFTDDFAIHRTAIVERGVNLKGAGIIGARCFIAAGSYLRGGNFIADDCTVGPGSELKSSFMFFGSKIAHLNFVGDSIIGSGVNIEAGAVVANYRNEFLDKAIRIKFADGVIETGVEKFGSLIGDNVRIGANAVIAPGALIAPNTTIVRLELHDQHPY